MNGGRDECKYWGNGTSIGTPRCRCKPEFEGEFCERRLPYSLPGPQKKVEMGSETEKAATAEVEPAEGEERHPHFPQKLGNPLEKLR